MIFGKSELTEQILKQYSQEDQLKVEVHALQVRVQELEDVLEHTHDVLDRMSGKAIWQGAMLRELAKALLPLIRATLKGEK